MIELAQHIEVLLLENDCVIVPGLGGFVAHYTPAMRVAEENVFLPPTRIIGFNPQLKMNDGLLVQSYMAVYDTDFSDATRIVEKEVAHIFTALHEEGKVDLPNIGELRYSIHGIYDFVPYDHKITTPYLYGLDSFEMQELAELGLQDIRMDGAGNVIATLPGRDAPAAPVLALIAHMDNAPDAPGENVRPRILRYEGGEVKLSESVSLTEALCPGLSSHVGEELVVTDGTTLLGADDKAGIAEIMGALEKLTAGGAPHGELRKPAGAPSV